MTTGPVVTGRVHVGPLDIDPVAEMPWLQLALQPEWSLDEFEAARAASTGFLISDSDRTPIGVALVRQDEPGPENAILSFLAVQPERRYRGLGGEAGLAVERYVRANHGVKRVFAGVPEGRGLAVYFWLRLGYRPLSIAEAPDVPLGLTSDSRPGIWMLRDTE